MPRERRTAGVTFIERTLIAPPELLNRLRTLCQRQNVDRSPQVVKALTEILDRPDEAYILTHAKCTDRMTISLEGSLDARLKQAVRHHGFSRQAILRTAMVRAINNLERMTVEPVSA